VVKPAVSIVVESYTHGKGASVDRVALALEAAHGMIEGHGSGEVLVADSSADPALGALLRERFPKARRIDAGGLGYDEAKMKAAGEADGEIVLYLDGDCIPGPGWFERHVGALQDGAVATGGFTRYDGGFLGGVESIMDFGFLLPAGHRPLACYAFNNSGFNRELLMDKPVPEGPMRCRCYAHAQLLLKAGTPMQMVPEATVRHERQPFLRERFRQGFDLVAAAWTDPDLPDRYLLRLSVLSAPLFYARAVANDLRRLAVGWQDLGLRAWQIPPAALMLPLFRLVDLAGILRALAPGGRRSGVGLK
jgi:glycosyl transferase family 2